MRSTTKTMRLLLPCLAVLLASAGAQAAPATIAITVYEDSNVAGGMTFTGTGLSLNTNLSSFGDFTDLVLSATILGHDASVEGVLEGTESAVANGTGHTLHVLISESDYTGGAPNYSMTSSSSYTYSNNQEFLYGSPSTDTFGYGSYATPGSSLFGTSNPSPGVLYDPLGYSGSNTEAPAIAFSSGTGYTLTESYAWTANDPVGDTWQGVGQTVVFPSAVPEPSSLILMGLGSLGVFMIRRRLRA